MIHARKDYTKRIDDNAGLIPFNEPVFLIRGQDKLGAETLRFYADRLKANGGDPKIISSVRRHATRMEKWPVKKFADLPAGK